MEVDWMSLGRAMHGVPLSRCCWASKQMSGHFAHGKNMVWWKQCSSAECPRCGVMQEDKAHIIKCPQDSFTTQWEATITNLTKWMKDGNSALHLIQALVEGLQAWQSETISLDDLQVSTKQSGIGWDGILDGWLSMEWQAQQEAYWAQWRWRKSSKWWTVELIKKLWNISWDLWDHWNEALHNSQTAHNVILDSRTNDQIDNQKNSAFLVLSL